MGCAAVTWVLVESRRGRSLPCAPGSTASPLRQLMQALAAPLPRPSPVLLSCGIPFDVARNALRLSVGRSTTRAEVDLVVQDLKQAVARLEGQA